jgi:hypothetical protein
VKIDKTAKTPEDLPKEAVFPAMSARKQVTLGKRSGLIVLGAEAE